jgi:hypothetical protein
VRFHGLPRHGDSTDYGHDHGRDGPYLRGSRLGMTGGTQGIPGQPRPPGPFGRHHELAARAPGRFIIVKAYAGPGAAEDRPAR